MSVSIDGAGSEGRGESEPARRLLGSVRPEPARRRRGPAARADAPAPFGLRLPSIGARIESFRHAASGLRQMVETEPHARIHLAATALVVILAAALGVSLEDWRWLLLAIAGVWVAEAFNTAIEALGDRVTDQPDPLIKRAKDIAAAGVLMAAALAAGIGALTFWPYLAPLLL